MPTVAVDKQELFERLGQTYTTEEFDELCFEFGIELDEDTEGQTAPGERPELKIEIGANRYDMLCIEGIARALNIFSGKEKIPDYRLVEAKEPYVIHVDANTEEVRPYVAGAVLRNLKFDQSRYDSFIALQDKLHSNLCRNRSLVAIGTHDLDKMAPGKDLYYKGVAPKDVKFVALNQTKEMTGEQLMEFYEKDKNLGKFLPLIRDSPVYPVYYDAEGNVMSMPPIINSEKTKIDLNTKNVFIDLSGTDRTKIEVVVNQIVTMFSEYCAEPFTIEPVKIISEHNGQSRDCPKISPRNTVAEVDYINSCVGLKLSAEEISKLLGKMSLIASPNSTDSNIIDVKVPATRSDILHQCDIMEDVGIAYGFNNLEKTFPADSFTIGAPFAINRMGDIFRQEVAMSGWSEVMPLTLCSHDENFKFLRRKDEGTTAVVLANPKTTEYQVVRTSLIPGVLKTIKENLQHSLPIKVFEVGDVVFKDLSLERQARNERRFCAIYAGKTSGFESVHGLLDRVMKMLNIPWLGGEDKKGRGYWIEEDSQNPTFFPGRGAQVYFRDQAGGDAKVVGWLGVFHPEVLENYDIPYAASAVELMVEPFMIE